MNVNEKSPVVANGNDGQTPLLVASFLGHGEIVRMLLAAGANPRINDYLLKATPVHKAAYAAGGTRWWLCPPTAGGRSTHRVHTTATLPCTMPSGTGIPTVWRSSWIGQARGST